MLKQRLFRLIVAAALIFGAAGAYGVVADSLGLPTTPPAFACDTPDHSGGGC